MKKIFIYIIIPFILISSNNLLAQPGFLDPTFGIGGLVNVQQGYTEYNSIASLFDKKIVAVSNGSLIDKYNSDGSIDINFGANGRLFLPSGNIASNANGIVELENNKLIVGGWYVPSGTNVDVLVIRTNSNGIVDSSFGLNGAATMDIDHRDYVEAMVVQPDGKIIVVGELGKNEYDLLRIFLARFNLNGSIDSSFGIDGHVSTKFDEAVTCPSVILQEDGKIVIGGTYNILSSRPSYYAARYNPNGSKDNGFGENGLARYTFGVGQSGESWANDLHALAIQQDGKIICAGNQGDFVHWSYDMGIVRFNPDGTLDHSYGEDGTVKINYPGFYSQINTLQMQSDGKLIAGAAAQNDGAAKDPMLLMRILDNGTLDQSFAVNGMQVTTNNQFSSYCRSSCLQDDGKIILGGYSNGKFLLARFNGDNVLASNFKEVKALQENDNITITWQTLNESNSKSYTVERSNNAKDYSGISTIPAKHAASNSYSYTDKNPLYGDNYYRIKENAANGSFTYSQTLKVVFENGSNISLYPNPAKNTVTIKGLNKNATAVIKITDINGREISKFNFSNTSIATLSIRALAQGSYFILVEQNGKVTKLRMVKE